MVDLYVRMVLAGQKDVESIKPLWRDRVRVRVYAERVRLGQLTLEDVPEAWRGQVSELTQD